MISPNSVGHRTVVWVSSVVLAGVIYIGLIVLVIAGAVAFDEIRATISQILLAAIGILVPSPLFGERETATRSQDFQGWRR